LPGRQAEIVVLKDAFDLSFGEISALEGLPIGTAKCYAHRARARLRARLEAVERAV
jgi:DNA-directed RNA polymerase specialized sigma24 family protein